MKCKLCGAENGIPEIPGGMETTFCVYMRNRKHKIVPCIAKLKQMECATCKVGEDFKRTNRKEKKCVWV